jgi:excisionase family DNA binding protein
MDRVIYADDVCERLNIKTGSLYKLINSKALKSFKLCGRRAFMQSDVDEYIRKLSGKKESHVVDIRNMSPRDAMAKGLEDIDWDNYSYDQLCKVWSLIGKMNEEEMDEKAEGY